MTKMLQFKFAKITFDVNKIQKYQNVVLKNDEHEELASYTMVYVKDDKLCEVELKSCINRKIILPIVRIRTTKDAIETCIEWVILQMDWVCMLKFNFLDIVFGSYSLLFSFN